MILIIVYYARRKQILHTHTHSFFFCFCSVTPAELYSNIDAGHATCGCAVPCWLLIDDDEAKPLFQWLYRRCSDNVFRKAHKYFKVSVFAFIVSNFEEWFLRVLAEPDSLCPCLALPPVRWQSWITYTVSVAFFYLVVVQTPAVSTVQLQFRAFSHSFLLCILQHCVGWQLYRKKI